MVHYNDSDNDFSNVLGLLTTNAERTALSGAYEPHASARRDTP
jgi:hypothetical protein